MDPHHTIPTRTVETEGGLYLINFRKESLLYLLGSLFKALFIENILLLSLFLPKNLIVGLFNSELLGLLYPRLLLLLYTSLLYSIILLYYFYKVKKAYISSRARNILLEFLFKAILDRIKNISSGIRGRGSSNNV